MTQIARPIADISIGNPDPLGVSVNWPAVIWSKINTDLDQGTAFCIADVDYPASGFITNACAFYVRLSALTAPTAPGAYTVTIHARAGVFTGIGPTAPNSLSGFVNYIFTLRNSTGSLVALREFINGWTNGPPTYFTDFPLVDPIAGAYHTFTIVLTAPEIAAITDWSALRVRLIPASVNIGDVPFDNNFSIRFTIGLVKFEVPDATIPPAPPVVDAGPDQVVDPSTLVQFAGTVTDTDPTTCLWTFISGPVTINPATAFSSATIVNPTWIPTISGAYVFRLTGSDGTLTAFDDVTITVRILDELTLATATLGFTLGNQGVEVSAPENWRLERFDIGPRTEERS